MTGDPNEPVNIKVQLTKADGDALQLDDTDKLAVSLYGKNSVAGDTALKVNADGELAINLEASDIEIGAVEIKNASTDDRLKINADGSADITVVSSVLPTGAATETTLGLIKSTDGIKKITDALPAGTNLLGKVGIDQTTDGTTNKVHAHSPTADDCLVNANMQVGDVDVSTTNPVLVAGTAAHDAAASGNPVQVGGIYRVADPALTDGDVGSIRVNVRGEAILALTGKASSATFTRPNDTTAYAAGDVVSTLAGAIMEFAAVGAMNDLIVILGSRLTIAVSSVPAGCTGFYLHLYNAAPTAIADNAVYNLPAGDLAKYLGYIVIGQPVDLGDNIVSVNNGINHTVKLASTSLYGIIQTIGAFTPTAQSVKSVTINVAGI